MIKKFKLIVLALIFFDSFVVFALVPYPKWGAAPDRLLLEDRAQGELELRLKGKYIETGAIEADEKLINWQNKDPEEDGYEGTSLLKLYREAKLIKNNPIVVAVIDSGVDINHEDIKDHVWTDPVTGVHGWNFLGNSNGENIECTTLELTREYVNCKRGCNDLTRCSYCAKINIEYEKKRTETEAVAPGENLEIIREYLKRARILVKEVDKEDFTYDEIDKSSPKNSEEKKARKKTLKFMKELSKLKLKNHNKIFEGVPIFSKTEYNNALGQLKQPHYLIARLELLEKFFDYNHSMLKYALNTNFDSRKNIIGDDPDNFADTANGRYGNSDVTGPVESAVHGTHVAGIILASAANENIDVQIMPIRAIPGCATDEYDKDVANSIRYAVDHGAVIINGSFGKSYSPNADKVKDAIKYAADHGVIIVHAAGNDGKDNDNPETPHYPNRYYLDGTQVPTWIEVGASTEKLGKTLPASFSNYGKKSVDLFAPGVDIYSSVPGNKHEFLQGTSMASPVVAGTLAVIYSQFQKRLTAMNALIATVRKDRYTNLSVIKPGTSDEEVLFSDLSKTGGIVDGYNGFMMAARISNLAEEK